ncbi:MAG: hypothetical protein HKN26_12495 [Acidimicrobiales bacterium]|nr:hypothetical protein [Acidimicrobiales bacterium]
MHANAVRYSSAARSLSVVARSLGLDMPGYRSPPGLAGVQRSIRRRPDGSRTIAVRLRGRPWAAVLADMVEGVIVANGLEGRAADEARTALWGAVAGPAVNAA